MVEMNMCYMYQSRTRLRVRAAEDVCRCPVSCLCPVECLIQVRPLFSLVWAESFNYRLGPSFEVS